MFERIEIGMIAGAVVTTRDSRLYHRSRQRGVCQCFEHCTSTDRSPSASCQLIKAGLHLFPPTAWFQAIGTLRYYELCSPNSAGCTDTDSFQNLQLAQQPAKGQPCVWKSRRLTHFGQCAFFLVDGVDLLIHKLTNLRYDLLEYLSNVSSDETPSA